MPRATGRDECVEENILVHTGGVQTIMLDARYTPYDPQPARIENLCGSFTEYAHTLEVGGIASRNGTQKELFHIHGNIVVNQGKAAFMAARGMRCLERLARSLRLSTPSNVVHMAVITSRTGKRAQVTCAGLLEATLARHEHQVRVRGRIYEQTNSVRFSVTSFKEPPFQLPEDLIPDKNDWTVTGRGMIVTRLIWKRLEWSDENERACLRMCDAATDWLQKCC